MQSVYLRFLAHQHLQPEYLVATESFLRQETSLQEGVVLQLLSFAHQQSHSQEAVVFEQVLYWIQKVFKDYELWPQVAEAFWVNLLAWSLQDLESSIAESVILDIGQSPFNVDIWEQFFNQQVLETQQGLEALQDCCAKSIAIALLPTFQAHFPSISVPDPSQSSNLLTVPLWEAIQPTLPSDRLTPAEPERESTADIQSFEYLLTHRHDTETLPWRITSHLFSHFHPTVAQIHLIGIAHTIHHSLSWETPFTLKASQMMQQRYFTQLNGASESPSYALLLQSLQILNNFDLSCLWLHSEQTAQTPAVIFRGKLWDMLLEPHGHLDWISNPDIALSELYITLRPSLWVTRFLNQSNESGTVALMQFRTIAKALVQQGRLDDIPFLKLLCHLFVHSSSTVTETVETLLQAAFCDRPLNALLAEYDAPQRLWTWWNTVVSSLGQLGWRSSSTHTLLSTVNCYPNPSPTWLDPYRKLSNPANWVALWLQQPVAWLMPAQQPAERTASTQRSSSALQDHLRLRQFNRLTGSEIRAARKARQWTQVQLAQALDVHPSLIAKIETGQRSISDTMEVALRKLLQLDAD
jgi:DNA-binding XRE family transcriptional regulator